MWANKDEKVLMDMELVFNRLECICHQWKGEAQSQDILPQSLQQLDKI